MKTLFFCFLLIASFLNSNAQSETFSSPFRKSYTRLGINNMSTALDKGLTPKQNMLAGNFGTDIGFVLDKGRIFYFMPRSQKSFFNVGLDWTIISLTYNSNKKKWTDYTSSEPEALTGPLIATISSKLGPVISLNPVDDLVIDVRGQIAAVGGLVGPIVNTDGYSLTMANEEAEKIMDVVKSMPSGLKPNFGATIRWRGIGLAADYSPGKLKMHYIEDVDGAVSSGVESVPFNTFQVKLNLSLKK